ncbi:MAG: hypothetical protein V2I57_04710 [Xanthomonadales bacterium]|jgi:hypothetical protein|nr:hypothetical protein [Xanthomonadales bacterium]
MTQPTRDWVTRGYAEAGLGTADPGFWLRFFMDQGGWSLIWDGPASGQPLWPHAAARPGHEWLLGQRDWPTGKVRLFAFDPDVPAPRHGANTWDTGGIFDLDLRVRDLPAWARRLEADGFTGMSEPITWPFGELRIGEWLAQGPDGVVLALVERLHPPLENPGPASGFGHAFNSSQSVRDVDAHLALFKALGFQPRLRQIEPLGGRGGEMLGLPANAAGTTVVDLAISHPTGELDGSVEFVAFPDHPGRHVAATASPGCRGLNLLRFPVTNIDAMARDLAESGFEFRGPLDWQLPPLGAVRGVALGTPDGSWLEFIEHL